MAKKQLKKINQPKKYLQGGSNMGSLSMMRQNPYYLGQVNQDAAEENLANSQEQVMQNKQNAAQAKKDARDMQNQQLDQTVRNSVTNLVQGASTDKKEGNLGKFFTKAPKTIGNTNPFAFLQAPAQSIGTGTAIEGIGVLAPEYMPAAQAGLGTAADAGVGVLAPEFIAPAADAGSTVTSAGSAATGLSGLASAGIGAAAMIGGKLIQKRTNDNSAYTFTGKEGRGNLGAGLLTGAGVGLNIGGKIVPGPIGQIGGALVGASIGAIKASKENKAYKEEAARLQKEQAAMRGTFQSSFVNSRLTGADTGFGLNSSTNMNNQFTNQYQVAKFGGVRKYADGGPGDPIRKVSTPATAADSSLVVNRANDVIDFYKNNPAYGIPNYKVMTGPADDPFAKLTPAEIAKRLNKSKEKYIARTKEVDPYIAAVGQVDRNGKVTVTTKPKLEDYYKDLGDNKFLQREITSGAFNTDSPMPLYDKRIDPQNLSYFELKPEFEKDFSFPDEYGNTRINTMGDYVEVPTYDVLATTPWKQLSKTEQIKRLNDFGESGSPYKSAKEGIDQLTRKNPNEQRVIFNTDKGDIIKVQDIKTKKIIGYETVDGNPIDMENPTQSPANDFYDRGPNANPSVIEKPPVRTSYGKFGFGGMTGIQEDRRTKKVPGGQIVPIEGTDAVEFKGKSHENGGVTIDKNTEVEGGETMDQVAMNDNNKQDYIFSKYLKLGGKSFAQRHKEILKGSGSQADIQQLAAMQEKVAGRNPQQVAAYGGFHKYLEGGASTADAPTACPEGYIRTEWGGCIPEGYEKKDNDTRNSIYKEYGYNVFKDGTKEARIYDKGIAKVEKEYFGRKRSMWDNNSKQLGTEGESIYLTKEDRKKEKRGKLNLTYPAVTEVKPTVDTQTVIATQNGTANAPVITDLASLDAAYLANKITLGEYNAKWKEFENPAASNASTATTTNNAGTPPIDKEEQDWRNIWIKQGYVFNAAGEREVPAGKKLVVNDDGSDQIVDDTPTSVTTGTAAYTTPTGITPSGNQQSVAKTDNASNVQGGVGATTTDDKLVGSKTSGFLPTFENAKENPLWTKENYPAWKSEVQSAIGDTDRQQKIVDYLSNYKGDYSAEVQKRIKGKTGQDLLNTIQNLATDNKPGIFHEAVRQALEASKPEPVVPPKVLPKDPEKPKEPEAPLPEKFKECPPGTYRSTDGTCKPLGDVPQGNRMPSTMLAGLGQLIPVGAALMNPYKIAPGIVGAPAVKGSLMPRMNLNQERASAIQQNVAYKNAVLGQNAGPAALVAMQSANAKTDQQMMQIAKQEQDTNRQLAAEEGKMGMQASMFNAENQQKTQMFNKEFNQKERQYRREDLLGALDTGAARIAGIVKDERSFKATERLANALDETGSYDRFTILEQLNKESKRKNSPYYGTTETERRRMAAAMHKELNPEGYVGKSEYTKLQEENARMKKEKEELEKAGKAKFGGARQYVSRLGELKGVRATKAQL